MIPAGFDDEGREQAMNRSFDAVRKSRDNP
jgi:hypothetical protein